MKKYGRWCRSLKELNVEGNQLVAMPAGLLQLRRLRRLNVTNNFMDPVFWTEAVISQPPVPVRHAFVTVISTWLMWMFRLYGHKRRGTHILKNMGVSIAAFPHYCTGPDVSRGNRSGCPLVVQYWADLQSVHGFRCCDNIARTRNVSECLYSLYAWLLFRFVLVKLQHSWELTWNVPPP